MGRSKLAPLAMRFPAGLARRIANAIEKNQARVVAGPDARMLDLWARLAPGRVGPLGRVTGNLETSN